MIRLLLAVALGGALGSLCRFGLAKGLANLNPHHAFSLGVLAANLLGSFLIGAAFVRLSHLDGAAREVWTAFLVTGLLGGLTTYSSYALDLLRLGQHGAWKWAAVSLLSHLVLGLAGVWAGMAVAQR